MPDQTMLRLPTRLRDRLRRYGMKGQTYAEILENLMNEVDHKRFIREQQDLLVEAVQDKDKLTDLRDL